MPVMDARYGGEEFVVLLPDTATDAAAQIAERMRVNVKALQIAHDYSDVAPCVTISIGVASGTPNGNASPAVMLEQADHELYRAKSKGRNQVCSSDV
jgi:diguanylate cyclase (GGDEF)-like protein